MNDKARIKIKIRIMIKRYTRDEAGGLKSEAGLRISGVGGMIAP
jgi:hypothetical protein